jgi:hypothetical protein
MSRHIRVQGRGVYCKDWPRGQRWQLPAGWNSQGFTWVMLHHILHPELIIQVFACVLLQSLKDLIGLQRFGRKLLSPAYDGKLLDEGEESQSGSGQGRQ